jgi:hypothetical protein
MKAQTLGYLENVIWMITSSANIRDLHQVLVSYSGELVGVPVSGTCGRCLYRPHRSRGGIGNAANNKVRHLLYHSHASRYSCEHTQCLGFVLMLFIQNTVNEVRVGKKSLEMAEQEL